MTGRASPGWRDALERALEAGADRPGSRFFQLATVDEAGWPRARTVVFRGFLDGTDRPTFTTDSRSEKVGQLASDPRAEACWWFEATREQFRLSGRAEVIGPGHPTLAHARAAAWAGLSESSRASFLWPDPGGPYAGDEAFRGLTADPARPPEVFRLVALDPTEVDHLDLAAEPQVRRIYRIEAGAWVGRRVNP